MHPASMVQIAPSPYGSFFSVILDVIQDDHHCYPRLSGTHIVSLEGLSYQCENWGKESNLKKTREFFFVNLHKIERMA